MQWRLLEQGRDVQARGAMPASVIAAGEPDELSHGRAV